jgi:hypothetical protein
MSPPLAESDTSYNMDMDIDDSLSYEPRSFGFEPQEVTVALEAPAGIFGQADELVDHGYDISELCNLPVDLDGMSWPWLHETLFLQNDPFAGLFDDTALQNENAGVLSFDGNADEDGLAMANEGPLIPSPSAEDHPIASSDSNVALAEEADGLVEYATKATSEVANRAARRSYWRVSSRRLRPILHTNHVRTADDDDDDEHLMHQVILSDYMPKFNRLWPMFSRYHFDPDALHPMLYLVVVSIGSMYGSVHQKHFGTLLHTRLRRLLAGSSFDLENPEGDMIWLAHARLLTQVQGLYFGQKQGFSYAQVCTADFFDHLERLLNVTSILALC